MKAGTKTGTFSEGISDLEEVLRCPITATPVHAMGETELGEFNAAAQSGGLRQTTGDLFQSPAEAVFVDEQGQFGYPMVEGIVLAMPETAVLLGPAPQNPPTPRELRPEKKSVQQFYDEFGWKAGSDGLYKDTTAFTDTRSVAESYKAQCRLRVNAFLPESGKYLLDAGSGAIPHPEYLSYSEPYRYRLCVDLSVRALREAKAKLGPRGLYVLGDITRLPIRTSSVDAAVSLHVLYHVPGDQQVQVLQELYRVMRSGAVCVVVYNWGDHAWLGARRWGRRATRVARRLLPRPRTKEKAPEANEVPEPPERPTLYFNPRPRKHFARAGLPFRLEVRAWSILSHASTKRFLSESSSSARVLAMAQKLEDIFPRLMGRVGQYPMFIFRKNDGAG